MRGAGFLAIWSDVEPDHLTDYRHWLTREHTTERVTTKGFLGVRVFRAARTDIARFFILYELEAPEVLDGPAYLARLNAPTPWSQRTMPRLGNFIRGGGVMTARAGPRRGIDHRRAAHRTSAAETASIRRRARRARWHCRGADRHDRSGAHVGADGREGHAEGRGDFCRPR